MSGLRPKHITFDCHGTLTRFRIRRTCQKWAVYCSEGDCERIYSAIPTWGPHPDVPERLSRIARHYPLVILSNADLEQIHSNVEKLGAPPSTRPSRRAPAAYLRQPTLRSDDGARHGGHGQSLRQSRV
jgi:hypothetical protein